MFAIECSVMAGFRKISIRSDWTFFHLVLPTLPDQQNLKILQLFTIQVADHRFKLEQKIGTESPCMGSILFRSGPIRCLFPRMEIDLNNFQKSVGTVENELLPARMTQIFTCCFLLLMKLYLLHNNLWFYT